MKPLYVADSPTCTGVQTAEAFAATMCRSLDTLRDGRFRLSGGPAVYRVSLWVADDCAARWAVFAADAEGGL